MWGVSKADVAREMGISVGQLNRKFPEEFRLSKAQLEIRLTTRLAQMGLEGDRQALISVLRAKFGWKDRGVAERAQPEPQDSQSELRKTLEDLDQEGRDAMEIVLKQMGAKSTLTDRGPGPSDPIN